MFIDCKMLQYILLITTVLITIANSEEPCIKDYYWRDYRGKIPKDALVGNVDKEGNPIYLAHVLHGMNIIPGQIFSNNSAIFFEYWHKQHTSSQNIKILCTQHPEQFRWIPTNNTLLHSYRSTSQLVNAGYEKWFSTYFGRTTTGSQIGVGKVICRVEKCVGLYMAQNDKSLGFGQNYEVLSFNWFYKYNKI